MSRLGVLRTLKSVVSNGPTEAIDGRLEPLRGTASSSELHRQVAASHRWV